jgi:hypothetical protein
MYLKNGVKFGLTADGRIGNLHVPGSGPFKPFVARRCRMAFRSGGRWKVEPQGSSASMNQIVGSEITECVGGLLSGRRDSRRPNLQEACG